MDIDTHTGSGESGVQNTVDFGWGLEAEGVFLNQGLAVQVFTGDDGQQHAADSDSLGQSIANAELELDTVPTKYVAAEMDAIINEREYSASNDWKINWDACKKEFVYSDYDTLENELGEIYGFYELRALSYNFDMFHTYLATKRIENWSTSSASIKCNFLNDLLDDLELVDEYKRSDAVLALNYLVQGCWKDLETAKEQLECIEESVLLLLQCNGFWRVWSLLNSVLLTLDQGKSKEWTWELNEKIIENCLNVLCTITNVALRNRDEIIVQDFLLELNTTEGNSVLITALDSIVKVIGHVSNQSFLLKKLLLLTKDLVLLSLGDSNDLRKLKAEQFLSFLLEQCRKAAGLKPCKEDTVTNCRNINVLQKSMVWIMAQDMDLMTKEEFREHTQHAFENSKFLSIVGKYPIHCLPWLPKSSLDVVRANFKESNLYKVQPRLKVPIWMKQKAQRLLQHLHVPLSAFHLQQEELIQKYPKALVSQEKPVVEKMEHIFLALLPVIENVTNSLVTVLTDAAPPTNLAQISPKNRKTNPPFVPWPVGDHATYIAEDSLRQSEIIVKAVSAFLILLLKHAKLNHVLQFECISSEIVAACAIPTILRFFNRNVNRHLSQRPVMPHPDSPFKGINVDLCINQSNFENISQSTGLSWRNTYSHINLLRVLNKLVKGKPSRILMLRMFKAHYCLKRCLNVNDSLFQQYALKLLKLQCKYLDTDWKRNNQCVISAIYQKVRHRLLEEWVGEISSSSKIKKRPVESSSKVNKWPWDHSVEEFHLHQKILSFLKRKYNVDISDSDENNDDELSTNSGSKMRF